MGKTAPAGQAHGQESSQFVWLDLWWETARRERGHSSLGEAGIHLQETKRRQRQSGNPITVTPTSADLSPHTAEAQKLGDLAAFPARVRGPGFCLISSCLSTLLLYSTEAPKPARGASETCASRLQLTQVTASGYFLGWGSGVGPRPGNAPGEAGRGLRWEMT